MATPGGRTLCAVVPEPGDADPDAPDLPPALRLGLLYLASNLGQTVTEPMLVAAGRYFLAHGSADDFLALAEVEVRDGEHWYLLRTALQGVAGKVCQAAGVSIPPPMRPLKNVVPKDNCALTTN